MNTEEGSFLNAFISGVFPFSILDSTVRGPAQLEQKLGKTIIDTQTYICIPNLINF